MARPTIPLRLFFRNKYLTDGSRRVRQGSAGVLVNAEQPPCQGKVEFASFCGVNNPSVANFKHQCKLLHLDLGSNTHSRRCEPLRASASILQGVPTWGWGRLTAPHLPFLRESPFQSFTCGFIWVPAGISFDC